ncbi:MAG: hypothetical protein ACD_30C00002G0013 [uncultured bacterium]|uniref:Large ribosomal subunit protein uL29 n=4 Tax=Candidatus Daviesiibacteriota TaxID=1752718 RepID=A0A0G0EY32_9BACT|nr:MAG: hypothetical protein ACD_30C00002G0013 [uncultured bacterium]KKQ10407.1 MAG: hypothetical protein US19_C0005G0019 [Candidatus Daviesbacteria bacterium GW2011_GWB1_36_5]KKQ15786.1 MAG: hypothetical protein US28_C0010G0019 [Candidatus Daviesbacteria bacterium GW2011_GWA1_36_8]OGE16566.1 MAG: 50S ribosomal protein L29 [Candidatus Daviesbacteria bacterium RIFCSPHIGHO2_01_FULL_36_37]OGE31753.1 MAG: 50S ribosomal protein L29 [Candidatus Daviesbacteria bacterium RIFCSPHIGHO2_02_FULL_37_9]OGE3
MKRNQLNETKQLDKTALLELVKKTRNEIADLVLDKNMSKLKDLKSISKKRKDLAQMLTVLRQKELLEVLEQKVSKDEKVSKVEEGVAA